jgi:hypothetical protein
MIAVWAVFPDSVHGNSSSHAEVEVERYVYVNV